MRARARLVGHAVHPMLVVFPLGLFATSVIFDIIRLAGGGPGFGVASFYMIPAGVLGGLVAAVFGLADWLAIPAHSRARQVGAFHGIGNVIVTLLFLVSWVARFTNPREPPLAAFILALVGVLLALFTGWLGGELVERLGVGVDEGAHADSPSSLSSEPASAQWHPARPLQPRKA